MDTDSRKTEEISENLIERWMSDSSSGIQIDVDGRKYHRPRKVEFETIRINETDLHRGGWKGFAPLPFLEWDRYPSYNAIRQFALQASERYLKYWFEVFDVVIARSLTGKGRDIFQKPFIVPNIYFDTGIPENPAHSSVPPSLHKKILNEYLRDLNFSSRYRIFYLSDYLKDITSDVNSTLQPYSKLWDEKKAREKILKEPETIREEIKSSFYKKSFEVPIFKRVEDLLSEFALAVIRNIIVQKKERTIRSETLRKLINKIKTAGANTLTRSEIDTIYENASGIGIDETLRLLYFWYSLPDRLYRTARSSFTNLSSAYRLKMRLAKLNYIHLRFNAEVDADSLRNRISRNELNAENSAKLLNPENLYQITAGMKLSGIEARLDRYLHLIGEESRSGRDIILPALWNQSAHAAEAENLTLPDYSILGKLDLYHDAYEKLKKTDAIILKYYTDAYSCSLEKELGENSKSENIIYSDSRYYGLEKIEADPSWTPGNPFHERDFINAARILILKRLRPLRMSASYYSLIPEQRHGAMTVNPIMRLWKDKIYPRKEEDPRITGQELNTKESVECLIRLAELSDEKLKDREVLRGKISGMKRAKETLQTMSIFLLPGSCFPIREIQRQNFPEFRNRVIGESRNPVELGVDPSEDSILTGAWYQKNNHSLFYPLGGDNGMLIRNIWNSSRISGPPAFYFALGQFVHDTLEDHEIYYRRDEKTFRNCVEEYYRFEDNIRKNRGEKTGRKKMDNSRHAVRFMFAVQYARLIMEILTGTSQSQFRHNPTEEWMHRKLGIHLIHKTPADTLRVLRMQARDIIKEYQA